MPYRTLQSHSLVLPPDTASYHSLPESRGPLAHFYAANGFPVAAYEPFLTLLAPDFELLSLDNRALWPGRRLPVAGQRCQQYAQDLVAFLQHTAPCPVIGIGHSMGATTTLMAAIDHPELFRRLILIEPVFQTLSGEWLTRLLPWPVLRRLQPFKSTLVRADSWPDIQAVERDFRAMPMFRRLSDSAVASLAGALTIEEGPGLRLAYPLVWERHNYRTLDAIWHRLEECTVPVTILHGRPSLFLNETKLSRLQKRLPHCQLISLPDHGHLLPIEAPEAAVSAIVAQM